MINLNIANTKKIKSIGLLAAVSCLLFSTVNVNSAEAARKYSTTTLTRSFRGVKSCGKSSRQQREAGAAVNNFLKRKNLPAYSTNWKIVRKWSKQRIRLGKRSCTGGVQVSLRYYTVSKKFRICNRTNMTLTYNLAMYKRSSQRKTIRAGKCTRYWSYHPSRYIVFDGSLRPGYQRVSNGIGDGKKYYFTRRGKSIEFSHTN